MKFFQFGVVIAIALCALLSSALWVVAQPSPPNPEPTPVLDEAATVEASAVDAIGLRITATVGTDPDTCAPTHTVQVRANTTVYYCFRLHNTGDESLNPHDVQTSRSGNLNNLDLRLDPNARHTITVATDIDFDLTDSTDVDVTNIVTWTARGATSSRTFTTSARVDVVHPSLSVAKTVGQDRTTCGSARSMRIPSGEDAAFCVTVENRGDITFTHHSLVDAPQGINATFNYTLAPGDRLEILPENLSSLTGVNGDQLVLDNVTSRFNNDISYTARVTSGSPLSVTAVSTASVDVGNTTVRFTKTLSTEPEICGDTKSVTVPPGTRLYYCATIENTGSVTLTHHQLVENWLSINVEFDYALPPGEVLRVTNDFLARHDQPIVFGPFEIHPRFGNVVNNQMNYTGRSPQGFEVSASDTSSASHPPTPTNTPTSRPDPTSTFTPGPTNTPTETPIPPTPTFTLTPTPTPVTPSPTPTRSYAISLLETPTPRAQSANLPQGAPQQPPGAQSTPIPGQEPALATATQIAVDATTTAAAATTTAVAATSTAVVAEATAVAQGQGPQVDSPLATPTIDPGATQQGDPSGLPLTPDPALSPAPQGGDGTALPASPTTEAPTTGEAETPAPSPGGSGTSNVTVMPPVVTVVFATETPGAAVIVVTNTPDPAAVLPDGQRPINYPTPTPTADYVMAAARTFDVAVTTFGWLWFLIGSLVFFVTAGIVAGMFFRQAEANRYDLPEPDYWLEEETPASPPRTSPRPEQRADDDWPADLP